jgi:hypothetical protein
MLDVSGDWLPELAATLTSFSPFQCADFSFETSALPAKVRVLSARQNAVD